MFDLANIDCALIEQKANGTQVAPAEIEDILLQSEDVADAAVIGIPR